MDVFYARCWCDHGIVIGGTDATSAVINTTIVPTSHVQQYYASHTPIILLPPFLNADVNHSTNHLRLHLPVCGWNKIECLDGNHTALLVWRSGCLWGPGTPTMHV